MLTGTPLSTSPRLVNEPDAPGKVFHPPCDFGQKLSSVGFGDFGRDFGIYNNELYNISRDFGETCDFGPYLGPSAISSLFHVRPAISSDKNISST